MRTQCCGGGTRCHDCPYTVPVQPQFWTWPPAPNMGWECPRCHRINAPSVVQCSCQPQTVYGNFTIGGSVSTPDRGTKE